MAGFRVALYARHRLVTEFVPKNFAGEFVEAEQAPLVRLFLGVGIAAPVKPDFQVWLGARLHRALSGECENPRVGFQWRRYLGSDCGSFT